MTGEPPNLERFAAFAALGCVFAFAYPRRWWLVLGLVLAAAFGFELAQLLAPGRHAGLKDALFKAAGGALGVGVGLAVSRLFASGSPGSPAA